jgi:hypothetical protein
MRIDLVHGSTRPWYMRLGMELARLRLGVYPGPPLTMSYRPELFHRAFVGYILRGAAGAEVWSKGEAELFASFVSNLNACHF